jgi:SAM-dependent methyltransferase
MDLDSLNWLQSPSGQSLLANLAERPLLEADLLGELTRLRRDYPADQANAAVELTLLRRRASAKFPQAGRMFFTREAMEQASAAPVAALRAARLVGSCTSDPGGCPDIADLCCGIGGDTLALAAAGAMITAVDRDPLRLEIVRANAESLGLANQVHTLWRDLLAEDPPLAGAIFCDPGRRSGGRRRFQVEEYEPPLSRILSWRTQTPALAVKLAPGVDTDDLPTNAEVEFVSLNGELKEASLWCGPLAQVSRRASVLRSEPDGTVRIYEMTADQPSSSAACCLPPATWMYEPDPAIIRAGLVTELAEQIAVAQIDSQIAYLTNEKFISTPFARVWPIITWQPFGLKRLRASLRELGAGPVTVKKRGSPLDTNTLARQLSGQGPNPLVVVLTRHNDEPIAIICRPPVQ